MVITGSIPVFSAFTGDTGPTLEFTVNKSDGSGALDCTDATAKCYIRKVGATTNAFADAQATATLIDGATGRWDYTLPTGGLTEAGRYYGQLVITLSGGAIQRPQYFQIDCREGLVNA
jgi:hypothetical protein